MEGYADKVNAYDGLETCSSWTRSDEVMAEAFTDGQDMYAENAWLAERDLEEVKACDVMLLFTEPTGRINVPRTGGCHFEAGYALASGKHLVVVGPAENIFCLLPLLPSFSGRCLRYRHWDDSILQGLATWE